jgi:hypothetical protein
VGKPRKGHPEGTVGAHVGDLLETIERWGETGDRRADLHFIAVAHDALKFRVREWLPKTGGNDHAMRARRLAERYTADERLLATIELHDRPYSLWRRMSRDGRLDGMLERIRPVHSLRRARWVDGRQEAGARRLAEGRAPAPRERQGIRMLKAMSLAAPAPSKV